MHGSESSAKSGAVNGVMSRQMLPEVTQKGAFNAMAGAVLPFQSSFPSPTLISSTKQGRADCDDWVTWTKRANSMHG